MLSRMAHLQPKQVAQSGHGLVIFISRLRLREACERLKNPETDVTSVAVDLGYSLVSFFSKQFKLAIGLAPSEYRRRRLEELEKQSRHKLMIESLTRERME
jgi:AraC-like DNA-binding protein